MARRGSNRGRGGGRGTKVLTFPAFPSGGIIQPFAEQSDNRRARRAESDSSSLASRKAVTAQSDALGEAAPSAERALRQLGKSVFSSSTTTTTTTTAAAKTEATSPQLSRKQASIVNTRLRKRKQGTQVNHHHKKPQLSMSTALPETNGKPFYEQRMAIAPAKCLLSEEGFRRLSGMLADRYVERGADGTYCVHPDQKLFDAQIAAAKGVNELSDDQIRYLFYRIEDELRDLAAHGRSKRHRLFMADRNDILNFAMPFNEYTDRQRTLIRNLCQDHLRIKSGFNDFYVMQVLIPEACIRIHMEVHGTTFEESDGFLDPGLVNLKEAIESLDATSREGTQAKITLTSILGSNENERTIMGTVK
ncbi:uncharacterized protein LOC111268702 isoform X2 [Varroa jacobsoni]|uniref:uncharacterized protein LOC111268702 isoform X2 n=1 Tax=Varroa jacobsoni TaxID=62625 RepID=UPI000BFA4563|nr:uncharacterized protein LOC111268702 isoform X2 [Varroa jacobsoni]